MKDFGYLLSIVSVFLIGYAATNSVADNPNLAIALWLGIALSVAGMLLRWTSHRRAKRREPHYSTAPAGK